MAYIKILNVKFLMANEKINIRVPRKDKDVNQLNIFD